MLECSIGVQYWSAVLECSIGVQYWSAVLECSIGVQYWSAVLQCSIGVQYCSAVLECSTCTHKQTLFLSKLFETNSFRKNKNTERIACILCMHLGACCFFYAPNCINAPQKVNLKKMHPAAFYFSCLYTNGISLRIIIKDYIITQSLINETALNLPL